MRYNDLNEGTNESTGKAINISIGGVKIKTSEILPVNEPLDFTVSIKERKIHAKGRVIYKYIDSEGQSNIGVVFEEISPEDLDILAELFQEILGR